MKRSSNNRQKTNPPVESRSLAKGLVILEMLADSCAAMPLAGIARLTGLGKASTLRLVRTLEATGHLLRDSNDRYTVEAEWPAAAHQILLRRLRECSDAALRSMSAQTGEAVALAFLFGDHIRVVEVIESFHNIRMSNYRGRILQPYASSLGKAIAAFQAPERIQALLDTCGIFPLTPGTRTSFRDIQEDFASVRQRGYAWDREETVPGGICIGAPLRTPQGNVIASVSLSMPKVRFNERIEQSFPAIILQAAETISAQVLGGD